MWRDYLKSNNITPSDLADDNYYYKVRNAYIDTLEAENKRLKEYLEYCSQWFKENPPAIGARLNATSGFDFLKPMRKLLTPAQEKSPDCVFCAGTGHSKNMKAVDK